MPPSIELPASLSENDFLRNSEGLTYLMLVTSPSGSAETEVLQPVPK
jgi:hypothetical protein